MGNSNSKANPTRVKQSEIDKLLAEEIPQAINFDTRPKLEEDTDRLPVFYLNGVEYSIPRRINMSVGLRFIRNRSKFGADVAITKLMEEMLGEEAYDALLGYDGVTDRDFEVITEILSKAAMGKLEAQKKAN